MEGFSERKGRGQSAPPLGTCQTGGVVVHCSRRRTLGTLLALAMLIALTTFLVVVGNGRAEEPAVPEPTVVRELVEKRTADSNTYLLSNGAYRCVMWASDVNHQDEKGEWLPIDATFIPVEGNAALTTASAPVRVTVQSKAPRASPRERGGGAAQRLPSVV
jgi:hypothetical protein